MRQENRYRTIGLGEVYVHQKTGAEYIVVDKCKLQVNGEWFDGIIYRGNEPTKFVRTEKDFRSSFVSRARAAKEAAT